MAHILDTTPAFEAFARKAFLESPFLRETLWEQRYETAHPEVFAAFYAAESSVAGRGALVQDLSQVREVAKYAAPVMTSLIGEVEPVVADAMGMAGAPTPQHVLLVGPMSTSAAVGRLDGDVTLFHCLEWFNSEEGARVLVAHEDAHAFHQMRLEGSLPTDAAWMAFYEGVAMQVSRAVVPGRAEEDYFWYGYAGFSKWLPWCQEQRGALEEGFAAALDDPEAGETYFGSGLVEGRWRVGFYLADYLVGGLGLSIPELISMTVEEGRAAIVRSLAH